MTVDVTLGHEFIHEYTVATLEEELKTAAEAVDVAAGTDIHALVVMLLIVEPVAI